MSRFGRWWLILMVAAFGVAGCADADAPPADTDDGVDVDMRVDVDDGIEPDMQVLPDMRVTPEDEGVAPDESVGEDEGVEADQGCEPVAEVCNGADDDCDGTVDEETGGGACETGEPGTCNDGTEACVDGALACVRDAEPGAEICDGLDNDCNGEVDDVEGLGEGCTAGVGACAVDGVTLCDGGEIVCDAVPGEPSDEVCDGADNDCNGEIDDVETVGDACSVGVGDCAAMGTIACVGGGLACDAVPGAPAAEVCDGRDNDCNGEIDDAEGVGEPCQAGEFGCAVEGTTICTPDGVVCDAVARMPQAEVCDGNDSDCNGVVDDVPGAGTPCSSGVGACAVEGTLACGPEGLACDAVPSAPSDEVCDGVDNDCDGVIDDVDGLGAVCQVGEGACERVGVTICTPDGVACDAEPGQPSAELCDGVDNDCNGAIDDDPACAPQEDCGVEGDEDGNGLADCDDPACALFPACVPPPVEDCATAGDEDGNGLADCEDPACVLFPDCEPPVFEDCDAPGDEDGNGLADCDDPICAPLPQCVAPPVEDCGVRGDEDGNGLADCADPACADFPGCGPPPAEDCARPGDEDGNRLADCDDPACADFPGCQPAGEDCATPGDEDGNRLADCDDPACADFPGCQPLVELCGVRGDEDGNGLADCADPACVDFPGCGPPPAEDCATPGDEDGNRLADCDDPACEDFPGCAPVLEDCAVEGDEDGNGLADCADPACAALPECLPGLEECAVTGDEDGNGLADCLDPACADAAVCVVTPIAARGGSILLDGVIDEGDPTWVRPSAGCGDDFINPDDLHPYEVLRIVNDSDELQYVDIEATYVGGVDGDGYVHVYTEPFDPADRAGCVIGDDDGDDGRGNSQLGRVAIRRGEVLVIVVSSYYGEDDANNRFIGAYDVEVTTLLAEDCGEAGDEDGNGAADCADVACADEAQCRAVPIAAPGGAIRLDGSLDQGDPTWARPSAACAAEGADLHPYELLRIVNNTGAPQVVDLDAFYVGGVNGDGYLHVYTEPFDPVNRANCVRGDDDGPGGTFDSQLFDVQIAPGQVLVLVVSSYYGDNSPNNRFIGDFEVVVTTQVPPPVEDCAVEGDEDGNGLADCDDAACGDFPGCPAPIARPGGTIDFVGALDEADPLWDRPTETCEAGDGNDHPYAVHRIVNNTGSDQAIDIFAAFAGGIDGDGYLHVYTEPFDPDDLGGCLAANDDGTVLYDDSLIEGLEIAAGEVLVIVVSTYNGVGNANEVFIGDYTVEVTTLLPPGTTAIAAPGASVQLAGTLDQASPTWARPSAACAASPADQHPYVAFPIFNDTGAQRFIDIAASFPGGDGYLHLFRDTFQPPSLLTCVVGNDDGPGGVNSSAINNRAIAAGQTMWVVVSTFYGDSTPDPRYIGAFTVNVTTRP